MIKTPCEKCKRCLAGDDGYKIPAFINSKNPDILVLSGQPGLSELKANESHVSVSGQQVRAILKDITDNYVLETVVKCVSDKKPTKREIKLCRENWMGLVRKYKPKVIVTLGAYAAQAISVEKIIKTSRAGKVGKMDVGGERVLIVHNYDPAYVMHASSRPDFNAIQSKWFDVWDRVSELIKDGGMKLPEVEQLTDYSLIKAHLEELLKYDGKIAYDYETWGNVDARRPELNKEFKILCIGVATKWSEVSFLLDDSRMKWKRGEKREITRLWKKIIKSKDRIAQNAKYEHKCNFLRFGHSTVLKDTMLQMSRIDETAECNLEAIATWAKIPWSFYKSYYEDVSQRPEETSIKQLLHYNGLDALATLLASEELEKELKKRKLMNVVSMQETYAYHLAQMEITGMHVDAKKIVSLRKEINKKLVEMNNWFYSRPEVLNVRMWAENNIKSFKKGNPFNPKSPVQIKQLCLNELKLKIAPDKNGKYSFDKDHLAPFIEKNQIVKNMNEVRSLSSMLTGFLNKWDSYVGPSGCVHTQFNQTTVVTGRLSSSSPNLQNIPRDSVIKKAFTSRFDGGFLINSDFRQLEPNILAGWSKDKLMCEALNDGLDIHKWVSAQIYDIDYNDVTDEQRNHGKRMNLGQMYGQTEHGLSKQTNLTLSQAKDLMDAYNKKFPGILKFRHELHKHAIHNGYVEDLFGSRRYLPGAQSSDRWIMEGALRQAGNAPIQSTGNQFCLISMCHCRESLQRKKLKAVVICTVHDSLIIDCAPECVEETSKIVEYSMLVHNKAPYWADSPVKMKVDMKMGPDLYEMKAS